MEILESGSVFFWKEGWGGVREGKGFKRKGKKRRGGKEERRKWGERGGGDDSIHFTSEEGQRRRHLHRHGQQDHSAELSVCS